MAVIIVIVLRHVFNSIDNPLVVFFIIITITRYNGFADSDCSFCDAFGGFVSDFDRHSHQFVDASLQKEEACDNSDKLYVIQECALSQSVDNNE